MDDTTLDAIEARAKAVPRGWDRWAGWQHYQILALVTPTQIDGWAHPEKRADAMERTEAAVEHIVGMDPATTLALVAEVRRLRAKVAAVEAVERGLSEGWVMLATVSDRAEFVRTFRAALATTGEGQHVAREVFTAEGIPFVRCSCTNAKSPTSSRWLTEHVPNGGVAELQAVVKLQAEGAKA